MFHALIFLPWQHSGSYSDKTEFTLAIDLSFLFLAFHSTEVACSPFQAAGIPLSISVLHGDLKQCSDEPGNPFNDCESGFNGFTFT